jgi:hypothetical protein
MECEGDNMFLSVYKLVRFFHINEYVLIKRENPIYITWTECCIFSFQQVMSPIAY